MANIADATLGGRAGALLRSYCPFHCWVLVLAHRWSRAQAKHEAAASDAADGAHWRRNRRKQPVADVREASGSDLDQKYRDLSRGRRAHDSAGLSHRQGVNLCWPESAETRIRTPRRSLPDQSVVAGFEK